MKHRSVIAYVIVAAALFAAPQLSHDLQNFRDALGSRLSVGLMQTFLRLPSAEGAAGRVGAPRPAETQLASCSKRNQAAKPRGTEPARTATRAAEPAGGELAMMIEPPPVSEPWKAALPGGSTAWAAELPHGALGEVAMIIPPDSGLDPKGRVRAAADASAARSGAAETRRRAEQIRFDFVAAARSEGKSAEWRKAEDALRLLEVSLPGSYEFRLLDREGSKTKVMKFKRAAGRCCAPQAPHAPRAAGVDAAAAAPLPVPAVGVMAAFVSE